MKKVILIILMFLSIFQIYATNIKYKTTVKNLRLRSEPTINDKIIRNLDFDEEVTLILKGKSEKINNILGNWVKVKTKKNEIGWCFDAYLKIIENDESKFSFTKIIYAEKNNKTVTVLKEDIENKSKQTILKYQESYKAELSGNRWTDMTPSISLNKDKSLLAFTDLDGLNIYNLNSNSKKILIKKISIEPKEVEGNDWSIKDVDGAYHLAKPIWINNNILFEMAYWEGSSIGVYNLNSNEFKDLKKGKSYYKILSYNNYYAVYEKSGLPYNYGLFISNKNLFDIIEISGENVYFSEAYYSNNKKYITYNYIPFTEDEEFPEPEFENYNINMLYSTENNEHTMIDGSKNYKFATMLLEDNNNVIYIQEYTKKESVIKKVNIKNKKEEIILKINNNKILKYINPMLINNKYYCFEAIIGEIKPIEKYFYIIDIKSKNIYYSKKFDNYFTTIIGFK